MNLSRDQQIDVIAAFTEGMSIRAVERLTGIHRDTIMRLGVRVGEGDAAVIVGGGAPIVVQSMTNTDTADVEATTRQVAALWRAGSEMVRITVDRDEAAAAVPHIRDALLKRGVRVPLSDVVSGSVQRIPGGRIFQTNPGQCRSLLSRRP